MAISTPCLDCYYINSCLRTWLLGYWPKSLTLSGAGALLQSDGRQCGISQSFYTCMNLLSYAVKPSNHAIYRREVMSRISSTGRCIEQVLLYTLR